MAAVYVWSVGPGEENGAMRWRTPAFANSVTFMLFFVCLFPHRVLLVPLRIHLITDTQGYEVFIRCN